MLVSMSPCARTNGRSLDSKDQPLFRIEGTIPVWIFKFPQLRNAVAMACYAWRHREA